MKSLNEFGDPSQSQQTTRHEDYKGIPKSYNKELQQVQTDADANPLKKGVDRPDSHHTGGTGLAGTEPFTDDGHMVQPGQGGARESGYDTRGSSGLQGQQSDITDREGASGLRSGEQGYGNKGTQSQYNDTTGRENLSGPGAGQHAAGGTGKKTVAHG